VPEPTLVEVPEPTLVEVPEPTLVEVPEPTLVEVPEPPGRGPRNHGQVPAQVTMVSRLA
jgi:hypothetical protein